MLLLLLQTKKYRTYLGLEGHSAAVGDAACTVSTEHTQAMVWALAQELTLQLTLLPMLVLACCCLCLIACT